MPVRNSRVASGITPAAGGYTVLYTVPDNLVLLLKSVLLFETAGATAYLQLELNASNLTYPIIVGVFNSPNPRFFSWSGWIALNAGDQVAAYVGSSQWEFWLSGALLPYAILS